MTDCGKVTHSDKVTANGALVALLRAGSSAYRLHVYRCRKCKGWHVGHYDKRRPR